MDVRRIVTRWLEKNEPQRRTKGSVRVHMLTLLKVYLRYVRSLLPHPVGNLYRSPVNSIFLVSGPSRDGNTAVSMYISYSSRLMSCGLLIAYPQDTRNVARIVIELARQGMPLRANTPINPRRRWQWMGKNGKVLEEFVCPATPTL